jgi:hypothetical protein
MHKKNLWKTNFALYMYQKNILICTLMWNFFLFSTDMKKYSTKHDNPSPLSVIKRLVPYAQTRYPVSYGIPPENRPQVNFCPNPVLLASGKWVSVKTAANSIVKSSVQSNCYFFFSHPRKAIVLYWSKYNWRIGYFWLHNTDNEQIRLLPLIFTDYPDELLLSFWLSTVEGLYLDSKNLV